jgi:hypothetical protein
MHYRRWLRTGNPGPAETLPRPAGPENINWKGRDAGYHAIHHRLERLRGKASSYTCFCGAEAADWSYDWTDPGELTDSRGRCTATTRPAINPCASSIMCAGMRPNG